MLNCKLREGSEAQIGTPNRGDFGLRSRNADRRNERPINEITGGIEILKRNVDPIEDTDVDSESGIRVLVKRRVRLIQRD
ncbi:hypothetical protein VNO77_04553 [Canavalia gladiata]|uniref:Uncharacterized protein n=1 Tax=Canavalia gladiata TaxID=3824 RepID=A0AAN9MYR1_CANGL